MQKAGEASVWTAVIYAVAAVALAGLANGVVSLAGWGAGAQRGGVVPRGWEWVDKVVGFVWVALFAGMGLASWLAWRSGSMQGRAHSRFIWGLIVVCMLYPVYTLGFQRVPGLIGNVAVVGMTCALIAVVWRSSRGAALLLMPVVVWVGVATVYVVKLIQVNDWSR